ncbi:MAG: hypothetical protein QM749_10495 [Aquabacterium sp.]
MKERLLFTAVKGRAYSLTLSEFGLSRPPQLTRAHWWRVSKPGRWSGLAVGLFGGGLTVLDAQHKVPPGVTPIFELFGQHQAAKVVSMCLGNLLGQPTLMFFLWALTWLVGCHRSVHGGVLKPRGWLGAGAEYSHTALQIGLSAVAFASLGFGLVAASTGAWRYALGFTLMTGLVLAYCALTWTIFRFMFVLCEHDDDLRSRLIGITIALSAVAMPWLLQGLSFVQKQLT